MKEVAGAILADHLSYLDRKGIPVERWLGRDPPAERSEALLRDTKGRVDWDLFAELCDSFWALVEPMGLEMDFADYVVRAPVGFAADIRGVIAPFTPARVVYKALRRFMQTYAFRSLRVRYEPIDRRRVRMSVVVRDGFRVSVTFFQIVQLIMARAPRILGEPDAKVDMAIDGRAANYVVTLAPRRRPWWRQWAGGTRSLVRALASREMELRGKYVRLAKHHEELEARVRERTRDLQIAKEQAEEASRAKSVFLASLSHELRTPLTCIIGFNDLLWMRGDDLQVRERIAEVVDRNSRQLLKIVDDLLDVARIEAGHLVMSLDEIDVVDEAEGVVASFLADAERRGIACRLDVDRELPRRLRTDPVRLRQVLANLVGNAMKYTESGSVVTRLVLERSPRRLRIEVEDTGCGIAPEMQAKVFQEFFQTETHLAPLAPPRRLYQTTQTSGGVGLGLTIARRLARALGGDLVLERSALGAGSLFVVTLPLASASESFG